jgi:signal transduction histidine kinase
MVFSCSSQYHRSWRQVRHGATKHNVAHPKPNRRLPFLSGADGRVPIGSQFLRVEAGVKLHPKTRPSRYVVFKVTDSGTGIPPEIPDRIFDPFFTTKPQGKGTGLGLATVLDIVEDHGGFVLVENKLGHGTTFQGFHP